MLEAELVTGRDCRKMSLPKIRWLLARAAVRRAEDRLFLAQCLGFAAALPHSKQAGKDLTELIADCLWAADAEPAPASNEALASEFSTVFSLLGIPGEN